MPELIDVIVIPPDQPLYTYRVENSLKPLQQIVGGLIERVPWQVEGVVYDVICHEEGLLVNDPVMNPFFPQLAGTVFITKPNLETGEWVTLSIDDQVRLMAVLRGIKRRRLTS